LSLEGKAQRRPVGVVDVLLLEGKELRVTGEAVDDSDLAPMEVGPRNA
jgi:hypothetical protein